LVIDTRKVLKLAAALSMGANAAPQIINFDLSSGPDRTVYWGPSKKMTAPDHKKRAKVKAARKQRHNTDRK